MSNPTDNQNRDADVTEKEEAISQTKTLSEDSKSRSENNTSEEMDKFADEKVQMRSPAEFFHENKAIAGSSLIELEVKNHLC